MEGPGLGTSRCKGPEVSRKESRPMRGTVVMGQMLYQESGEVGGVTCLVRVGDFFLSRA